MPKFYRKGLESKDMWAIRPLDDLIEPAVCL